MLQYRIFDGMDRCSDDEVRRMLPLVPAWRREQALAHGHTLGRYLSLKSYLLLVELLGEEPEFAYGEHGKPLLTGGEGLYFNMSHCRAGIAVAVSDRPVGIDIESPRRVSDGLMEHVLSERELEEVKASENPGRAFLRYWTAKEAVLKMRGTGLVDELREVLDAEDFELIFPETDPETGIVVSIAVSKPL